jgi:predicted Zn-dependent protease
VNEKYRDKGIEIIMATDIDKAPDLEKFIAEKKLKLGVARVADIYKLVKAQGYPTSYGIDVDGNCIWRGHPQGLNDALVDGWLKDLRAPKIPRKLNDALGAAVSAYDNGQYGGALNALEKLLKHKDEKVKADAQYIADLLNGRMEMNKAAAKIYRDGGELEKLLALLETDAKDFSGLDYAKDCASEAKKTKSSKAYKECVEAREKLERLKPTLKDMKAADAVKALNKLTKEFPETPAGKHAAEMAKEFEEKK